jgi:hypothetical protein
MSIISFNASADEEALYQVIYGEGDEPLCFRPPVELLARPWDDILLQEGLPLDADYIPPPPSPDAPPPSPASSVVSVHLDYAPSRPESSTPTSTEPKSGPVRKPRKWTKEEDDQIRELHGIFGNQWRKMADVMFPNEDHARFGRIIQDRAKKIGMYRPKKIGR